MSRILSLLGLLLLSGCFPRSGYKTLERIAEEEKGEKRREEKKEEKAKGRLFIITHPSFADIYIDEIYEGKSPLETELEVGSHRIKAELEGYYPAFATVWVDSGVKLNYYFSLERIEYGEIEIKCNVDSAKVYIDGKYRGMAPGIIRRVPIHSNLLEVKKFGYQPFILSLSLKEGERLTLNIKLKLESLRIEELRVKPSVLAPESPPFARAPTIILRLSKPAKVGIKILDEIEGKEYSLFKERTIKREISRFRWKPERIEGGDIYRVIATAEDSLKRVEKETIIRVNPFTRWRSGEGIDGSPGLLLSPIARTIGTTTLGISGRSLFTQATDDGNPIINLISSISLIGSLKENTELRLSYLNLTIPPCPATDTSWVSNSLFGFSLHQVLFKNSLFGSFATGMGFNIGNIKSYGLRGWRGYLVYSKDILPISIHIAGGIKSEIKEDSLYLRPQLKGGVEVPLGKHLLFELSGNRSYERLFLGLELKYLIPSYPLNFGFTVLGYTEERGEYLLFYGLGIEAQWFR